VQPASQLALPATYSPRGEQDVGERTAEAVGEPGRDDDPIPAGAEDRDRDQAGVDQRAHPIEAGLRGRRQAQEADADQDDHAETDRLGGEIHRSGAEHAGQCGETDGGPGDREPAPPADRLSETGDAGGEADQRHRGLGPAGAQDGGDRRGQHGGQRDRRPGPGRHTPEDRAAAPPSED
jgi:hypothetical protein